ncbi:MAG: hypothetical protein DSM106950_01370 [Stigonema ocellatum SAG 48.90 = DSM 106950]|nr:hypothetical protein [Stigonema ocellatum SAG 48.90 = DSM 106950]
MTNSNKWSDVDVTFDNGSVQRIALQHTNLSPHSISALQLIGCNPNIKYDCINGVCVQSIQYKTSGYFQSLADCQSACGLSKGCNGICIGNDEYQKIQGLINKISGELC